MCAEVVDQIGAIAHPGRALDEHQGFRAGAVPGLGLRPQLLRDFGRRVREPDLGAGSFGKR